MRAVYEKALMQFSSTLPSFDLALRAIHESRDIRMVTHDDEHGSEDPEERVFRRIGKKEREHGHKRRTNDGAK